MEQIIAKLLQNFEEGKMTRRQLIQSLTMAAAAASTVTAAAGADSNPIKAINLNHVGYQCADYAKSRDWYSDLFGMKVGQDNGKDRCSLAVGDSFLILHNKMSASPPVVDHISFTLANWDSDPSVKGAVGAELKRRGLDAPISYGSYFFKDPDGFEAQVGGTKQ